MFSVILFLKLNVSNFISVMGYIVVSREKTPFSLMSTKHSYLPKMDFFKGHITIWDRWWSKMI